MRQGKSTELTLPRAVLVPEVLPPSGRSRNASLQRTRAWLWQHWEALAYIALAADFIWMRFTAMQTSFTVDEAATAVFYVDHGLSGIYSPTLYATNNHILFSILSWITVAALGHHEANYRIWSVLPAIASAALLVWWTRQRISRGAGLALAAILLMAPLLLKWTVLARGYGLEQLGIVLLLIGAVELEERGPRRGALMMLALGIFVGPAAQPSMILSVPLLVLFLLRRRELRRPVLGAVALGAIALAIVVGPLVPTMVRVAPQNEVGAPLVPAQGLLTAPIGLGAYSGQLLLTGKVFNTCQHQCYTTDQLAKWGWPLFLPVILGGVALWRWRRRGLLGVTLLAVFGTFAVIVAGRIGVNDRFTLYLFPVYALLAAIGVSAVVHAIARRRVPRALLAAAGTVILIIGAQHIYAYDQMIASGPHNDYKGVADAFAGSGVQKVVANARDPDRYGLTWYLGSRLIYVKPSQVERYLCNAPAPLAFIQLVRPLNPAEYTCLVNRHAASQDFPGGVYGLLRLWLVQAPGLPQFTKKLTG